MGRTGGERGPSRSWGPGTGPSPQASREPPGSEGLPAGGRGNLGGWFPELGGSGVWLSSNSWTAGAQQNSPSALALAREGAGDPGLPQGPTLCGQAFGTSVPHSPQPTLSLPSQPTSILPSSRLLLPTSLPAPHSSDCSLLPLPLPCVLMARWQAAPRLFPPKSGLQPGEMLERLGWGWGR